MRELLGYVEDFANAQMSNSAERSHNDNNIVTSNNTAASLENSDDGCTEIVTIVQRREEALIVNVKVSVWCQLSNSPLKRNMLLQACLEVAVDWPYKVDDKYSWSTYSLLDLITVDFCFLTSTGF
ncbi:hypothetical protein OWV82_006569 [Melia azedarach]|uniref:Uncharacterized protein n=1 Tax=Melia azedarach TaxID=155640 RepID=A0ACC1YJ75_MELAZ|nr:hypothetical protein OWV82_006569 [Melia azedarach]